MNRKENAVFKSVFGDIHNPTMTLLKRMCYLFLIQKSTVYVLTFFIWEFVYAFLQRKTSKATLATTDEQNLHSVFPLSLCILLNFITINRGSGCCDAFYL